MEKIKVFWELEGIYINRSKSKLNLTEIDVENTLMSEEEWNNLTREQKIENIESLIQEEFEQHVGFSINDYGIQ